MAELWFPVPPLAGDVVLLRPWREADVPGMVLAFSDPVMQRFSWRTTPYTETDARDYFAEQEEARLRGEGLNFALVEPHDQDVVLGSDVTARRWGKGIGAPATAAWPWPPPTPTITLVSSLIPARFDLEPGFLR